MGEGGDAIPEGGPNEIGKDSVKCRAWVVLFSDHLCSNLKTGKKRFFVCFYNVIDIYIYIKKYILTNIPLEPK